MTVSSFVDEVKNRLDKVTHITILTHINPDADTLGSGLGIYRLLSNTKRYKIEIVNASVELPRVLDFLSNYSKIKREIEYEDSLIITCDCGSLDRVGFDLAGRFIINIDHHKSNTIYGDINIVFGEFASAAEVAFELFKDIYTIDKETATSFYAGLLSDTRYFTTSSMSKKVFQVAYELVSLGARPDEIAKNFTQRRSLSSLRILQKSLDTLTLHIDARVASMSVTLDDIETTGALVPEMDGIVDYAKSLTTVDIAIFIMEREDGVRVSLRSKGLDISIVALSFGGGGHVVASGFTLYKLSVDEAINIVLNKIIKLGILNEKK